MKIQQNKSLTKENTKNLCSEPGCGRPVRCKDLCTKHYTKLLKAQGRIGKTYVCKYCEKKFRSPEERLFCSLDCYLKSDLRKEHDKARSKRMTKATIEKCLVCKVEMPVPPCQKRRGKKFCSQSCYRVFLSERFDRWIANPKTIEELQGFDEFLSKEKLPCLIEGCEWSGKNLSQHVNKVHGIKVEKFKEMVGFNEGTGIISADLQKILTKVALKNRKFGRLKNGPVGGNKGRKGKKLRKEHLEHLKKSQALKNCRRLHS